MHDIYWSQRAANLLRENMIPVPDDFYIYPDILYGCGKQDFISAFKQLHQLVADIYSDMAQNPADYALPLYEIEKYRSADREGHASGHSLRSLGLLFYNMGQTGEISDGKLVVGLQKYKVLNQQKKVTGASHLMNKLSQFGFEFTGFNGKGFVKGIDAFTVAYPKNPNVMSALKGYAMTLDPEHHGRHVQTFFYTFLYKLFGSSSGYYIPDESCFSERLGADKNAFFDAFNARMVDLGYTQETRYEGPFLDHWKVDYLINNKITSHCFYYNADSLIFRLKLNNAGSYIEFVENCSESVRSSFENNQPCSHCHEGECGYRVSYSLHGTPHEACIYSVFQFNDPKVEDIESYIRLVELEKESSAIKKKK
ncbi:MAG: hypothetical protein ACYC27_07165 [Armatimonadota bacterium]